MKNHCKYDELVDPRKLKVHPKNRNKHSLEQVGRLAELYKFHGIRHPIIVSKLSGCIVAGHGRKQAAELLKLKKFPVVYQNFEDKKAEYAFLQADNAIALWAELDIEAIRLDLPELGKDFDTDILGLQPHVFDLVSRVNTGDENDEWAQMGEEHEFKKGKNYISLAIHFQSEKTRDKFIQKHSLKVERKLKGVWIVYQD